MLNKINSVIIETMLKNILGLVGSPRRYGNCEIFIKEIAQHFNFEHNLKLIRLPELNIMPCRACYGCIMGNPCPNRDDLERLLKTIINADGLIITTPVYYFGAHSIYKRILDRGFLFYNYLNDTYGKPCILINFYGIKDRIGASPQALMVFAHSLGLKIKASVSIQAALPGEVLFDNANKEKAEKLAGLLFSDKGIENRYGCPFCGSEIIRMVKEGFICTVCHGHFKVDSAGRRKKIKEGGILGPPEHMFRHRDWLRGMKERFLNSKKEIVKAISGVRDKGEWIKFD
ncbi:MAG: flavodoxin family protein [Syntrophorhabdaceae bacterium]|nr:flavodoxin family protein [Syntrophorhabdaceae bacterium]